MAIIDNCTCLVLYRGSFIIIFTYDMDPCVTSNIKNQISCV